MRATRSFLLSALLLIPMLGSLPGCTQRQWWDDYTSKTETMKFLTFEPCDTWFASMFPEHQMYFHVTGLFRNADGSYRVDYQQQSEWVYERVYFRSVQYLGLRDFTAVPLVWVPSDTSTRCAALVVLPWSSGAQRPFAYPEQSLLRDAANQRLSGAADAGLWAFATLVLLVLLALPGFSADEHDAKMACLLLSVAAVVLNASILSFNIHKLSNIDALASFYDFYDTLPRSAGHLLPLQWSQAHRLFDGPPYPTSLTIDNGLFWIVLSLSSAAWLAAYARRICIGIAYATMPDPFEELRSRLAAEGGSPTPEEYVSVLTHVGATASTWQLELLKRRMKEWCPDA